jgi:hypothetical protein
MARAGLNCTLSYVNGAAQTYQVRAGDLSFGAEMIATESAARIYRAYYPHKSANQQFSVQVLLKNWAERSDFMNWLSAYAQWALDPNAVRTTFPYMTVNVSSRSFYQRGLPLTGFEWGAHTGMMAFAPVIVFESAYSPSQSGDAIATSSVINQWSAFASDPAIQYFYPFGTQLDADSAPENYSQVQLPASDSPSSATSTTSTQLVGPSGKTAPAGASTTDLALLGEF